MQNKFNLPVLKLRKDLKKSKFGNIFIRVLSSDGEGIKNIIIMIVGVVHGN